MKDKFLRLSILITSLLLVMAVSFTACKKDTDGSPDTKASAAMSGSLDSTRGGAGASIVLKGSGLGKIKTILFQRDSVNAPFITTLNTETSLVFRVPDNASGGQQNIIFTNVDGNTLTVPFFVIAMPTATNVTRYSFAAGEQITITGNNLDDVSAVTFDVAGTAANIVSKTRNTLVITMPASTAVSTKLKIVNSSGNIITTQEFINADQAFVFFREGYGNGEGDASWGDPGFVSTAEKISGTASLGKKFAQGNWHNLGFGWNWIARGPYQNISFWIKGGLIDHDVWVFANSDGGGSHEQAQPASNKIVVKAGVWQYFKIPLNTLNLWADGTAANGNTINKLGWFLKGPDNADETLFLDDVMFIK